jgi:Zn-dependent M16 (insulinase) family peptidase
MFLFDLSLRKTTIKTFKNGNLRLVFVSLPGPLVSASIVVPTLGRNHKGLAHTLEHLIFMGTDNYPRGYLDNLAIRSLSNGTNAYTTEDHTAYTITTVGQQGMLNVLPVFMDHVLHPKLSDDQFTTEVFGIDGSAKHQGVVYCEMASRENTEADLVLFNQFIP